MKYLKDKKFLVIYTILIILGIATIVFSNHNEFIYQKPIAKITNITNKFVGEEETSNGYISKVYEQDITAVIKNGNMKGKVISIKNQYHEDQAFDQKYHKNDKIFISISGNESENRYYIEGYKRDKYIVMLTVFLILFIILIGHRQGFLSLLSVTINILIFYGIVFLNTKNISLSTLSVIGSFVFCICCLLLVSGFNKKTYTAIISCLSGITITLLITLLVIKYTNYSGIFFEQVGFLSRPAQSIFLSEIIIGSLGAIMDISITISSSLHELLQKDPKITKKSLLKSGMEIGKDVTSTMINVLFFTFICGAITNLVIYYRNGINLNYIINDYISIEMCRALTGAIGITVTIPISVFITTYLYKKGDKNG